MEQLDSSLLLLELELLMLEVTLEQWLERKQRAPEVWLQ
jgi:hypothetical protein